MNQHALKSFRKQQYRGSSQLANIPSERDITPAREPSQEQLQTLSMSDHIHYGSRTPQTDVTADFFTMEGEVATHEWASRTGDKTSVF